MKIKVRFYCSEIVGELENGEYDIPQGATVAEAMQVLAERKGTFIDRYADYLLYLVNRQPAQPDSVLKAEDSLTVLRRVMGG